MKLQVRPSEIEGAVSASPSKSYTHRAMVLALLGKGTSRLDNVLLGGDTLATLNAVRKLGGVVTFEGDRCVIEGGHLTCPDDVINTDNSGTTIRIVAGIASLLPCHTVLTGDESIRRRPMQPLISALCEMGVECYSTRGNGLAPLIVKGPNRGAETHIPGDISSQFISSLLISSPLKDVDTDIHITTELKSRPYVEITIGMMSRFGVRCSESDGTFHVPGGQSYQARDYIVPGDFSSAAFPLAAGALAGKATVTNLDPEDDQGDRRFVGILKDFGAKVEQTESSITVRTAPLQGMDIDLADAPDLFPIAAVVATQAKGISTIFNAEHVRFKESDRIASTVKFLKDMGADIQETKDGCVIRGPCHLRGTEVDPLADHRILMAAAVAALVAKGDTLIEDGDCFKISYPGFVKDMVSLGASVEVQQ
jgi:3-phosphoshikimate 1-carboxyvinyltransferase